jgi:Short C-terminal domain
MSVESIPSSGDARSPDRAGVPATPSVSPDEMWQGAPNVLVDEGRHTIGWLGRPENKGGPVFVIVRLGRLGGRKVVERHPMTDQGWSKAWRGFVRLDPAAAGKVLAVLAGRAQRERLLAVRRELGPRSLAFLSPVVFVGGHVSGTELAPGQRYELRFLEERLLVFAQDGIEAPAEFAYGALEAIEVDGPGRVDRWSTGQQALILDVFGEWGALAAYSGVRIKTFVRIQTADGELFFLHTSMLPEDVRVLLSRGISAVREARASLASAADGHGRPSAVSLVDELTRLAGLLDQGLLTKEEFDQLKARLITEQ